MRNNSSANRYDLPHCWAEIKTSIVYQGPKKYIPSRSRRSKSWSVSSSQTLPGNAPASTLSFTTQLHQAVGPVISQERRGEGGNGGNWSSGPTTHIFTQAPLTTSTARSNSKQPDQQQLRPYPAKDKYWLIDRFKSMCDTDKTDPLMGTQLPELHPPLLTRRYLCLPRNGVLDTASSVVPNRYPVRPPEPGSVTHIKPRP